MLAHWFNRSGIGQLLAPDRNAPPTEDDDDEYTGDEALSGLLQLLAPDPKFAPPAPPPRHFQCQHCHKWTPVQEEDWFVPFVGGAVKPDPMGTTDVNMSKPDPFGKAVLMTGLQTPAAHQSSSLSSARNVTSTPFLTPSPRRHPPSTTTRLLLSPQLERNILSAAQSTAEASFSPPPLQQVRDKVFRACSAPRMDDRLAKRLRSLLLKDPSLLYARATHLGDLAPDGFTPLQTAAYAGSMRATELILELGQSCDIIQEQDLLTATDLKGRTALHVAAERGHVDIVQKLLPLYQLTAAATAAAAANQESEQPTAHPLLSSPMPVDILGRTPFGSAITSPNPTARKRKKELEKMLFSPTDLSVFGVGRPELERIGHDKGLRVTYGTSDMPGRRVLMEDALAICRFQINQQAYLLLGVCDGHGDQGLVSDFCATNLPRVLQDQLRRHVPEDGAGGNGSSSLDWPAIWKTTCLHVDQQLKDKGMVGGSTAVFALLTEDLLVVANVGDSRIILVQQQQQQPQPQSTDGLEAAVEQLSLSEENQRVASSSSDKPLTSSTTVTVPLSDDHKPNLPAEQARVEAAGMKVTEISFEEEGKIITIPKILKSEGDMMAVSRAFGDFEYKANTTLGPEEQAVICLPEVRVHVRSEADQYLVLACDGIWDVCSNDMVKDFVIDQVQRRTQTSETVLPEVGDALLLECLNVGSQDNMSVIVVALGSTAEGLQQTGGKTLDFNDA